MAPYPGAIFVIFDLHMKKLIALLIVTNLLTMTYAQQEMPLYSGPIPNSKPGPDLEKEEPGRKPGFRSLSLVSQPTLASFLPAKDKATGAAVVICPGGGYQHLAIDHEGMEVARLFNEWGIASFVLKYRLPSDDIMVDKKFGPLQDAQRAIQLVREHAAEWNIDPKKVGIMGFSAGGHLASTAGTHFDTARIENKNNISLRPDFMILIYPVISFSDAIAHKGSRENLIGKQAGLSQVQRFSNELHVNANTPPTFLLHATDDRTVPVDNSIQFYEALIKNKVPAEMHIFQAGGHGFGLHNPTTDNQWSDALKSWLTTNGWIKK